MTPQYHQITVSVAIADDGPTKQERRRKVWKNAVAAAWKEARKRRAMKYVPLEIPFEVARGWLVTFRGVTFRCLVVWTHFPVNGDYPRWEGRVDLAWKETGA